MFFDFRVYQRPLACQPHRRSGSAATPRNRCSSSILPQSARQPVPRGGRPRRGVACELPRKKPPGCNSSSEGCRLAMRICVEVADYLALASVPRRYAQSIGANSAEICGTAVPAETGFPDWAGGSRQRFDQDPSRSMTSTPSGGSNRKRSSGGRPFARMFRKRTSVTFPTRSNTVVRRSSPEWRSARMRSFS